MVGRPREGVGGEARAADDRAIGVGGKDDPDRAAPGEGASGGGGADP